MVDPNQLIRPHIRSMAPYQPILPFEVLSEALGREPNEIVKLDANENPYGPPQVVQQALAELEFIHIYPDPESRRLRRALSQAYSVPMENLLAGAGADELIDLLMRLLLDPGDAMLSFPPTFSMYSFDGALNRAKVIEIPRRPDFKLDLPAIERAVSDAKPKLAFIANPNNPDGSLITDNEIEALLSLPLILALDEAYIEFADKGSSWLAQVPSRKNLVVLRTFSKWAGLAGLRLGFGAFPRSLMGHLWKIKQPYNVSVAASQAGLAALAHRDSLEALGQKIRDERARLHQLLTDIDYLQPYPSQANFILCRVVDRSTSALKARLAEDGILIRYFDKPGLHDHIRISVGRPQETDRLIEFLKGW